MKVVEEVEDMRASRSDSAGKAVLESSPVAGGKLGPVGDGVVAVFT